MPVRLWPIAEVQIETLPSSGKASALAGDLREERLVGRRPAEKFLDQRHLLLLASLREDAVAVARTDPRVEQVLLESREHVEREHLRPHVAVVPGGEVAR